MSRFPGARRSLAAARGDVDAPRGDVGAPRGGATAARLGVTGVRRGLAVLVAAAMTTAAALPAGAQAPGRKGRAAGASPAPARRASPPATAPRGAPPRSGAGAATLVTPVGVVALAPLSSLTEGSDAVAAAERLVTGGLALVPGARLVRPNRVRRAAGVPRGRDAAICPSDLICLAQVGRKVGAAIVVAGEVGALGEDAVVYLRAVATADAAELRSTTLVLRGTSAERQVAARGAAYRLLAPAAYVGRLALRVDVPGAVVYLDGRRVGKSPLASLTVPVGTHALRVTHQRYRDYLRFVEVEFDQVATVPVDLRAYPSITEAMRQEASRRARAAGGGEPPWYRTWWAVGAFGAVVAAATTAIVVVAAPELDRDRDVVVGR